MRNKNVNDFQPSLGEEPSLPASGTSSGFAFDEAMFTHYGSQVIQLVATYLSSMRQRAVWQPLPDDVRAVLRSQELPLEGQPFEKLLLFFEHMILPFPQGNGHPRFTGWITSPPAHPAILFQPLAAALNLNCGIGEHAGQELERRVVQWLMHLCGFPTEGSMGVLVSGGSEANLTCLQAARLWAARQDDWDIRTEGLQGGRPPFVLYQSDQGHFCLRRSVEVMGLGQSALRVIPSTSALQMDVDRLRRQIIDDRASGMRPFCVIANAGTVETGALDPFDALADLCAEQGLWLHVDGSYGAFARLDERITSLYIGIERADSLATDQHKWLAVPIDCGCALVRHGEILHQTFCLTTSSPGNAEPGNAEPWLSEYTFQRTRRFRALDVWAVLSSVGRCGLASAITNNNTMARLLVRLVEAAPDLELISCGPLSIVRFRYRPFELRDQPELLDSLNRQLVREIQSRGKAFLTSTFFQGREALRACIVNFMTTEEDIQALVEETLLAGQAVLSRLSH